MLVCGRWYAAYPLSLRDIEELMIERGVFVNHSTVHRRALGYPEQYSQWGQREMTPAMDKLPWIDSFRSRGS